MPSIIYDDADYVRVELDPPWKYPPDSSGKRKEIKNVEIVPFELLSVFDISKITATPDESGGIPYTIAIICLSIRNAETGGDIPQHVIQTNFRGKHLKQFAEKMGNEETTEIISS